MASKTFLASIGTADKGELFIGLPFDVKALFGRARPPVEVTIGAHTWKSTVSVYSGKYYLPVSLANREAAGVELGDRVKVFIASDNEPRSVKPPAALLAAMKGHRTARTAWNALAYSHQREHATAIESAKKPETQARRVEKTLARLLASP